MAELMRVGWSPKAGPVPGGQISRLEGVRFVGIEWLVEDHARPDAAAPHAVTP